MESKNWESATKVMNTARGTITAKAVRKEEKKERKAKEKDKEKTSFQGYKTCGKWRHKASERWQGYVQAMEEVPSSSTNSVAPSATTTPTVAKTAALIQEFNIEQGPGWIFGVVGGSQLVQTICGMSSCWISVDSMSVFLVFGHQFEQRGQGASARHSTTQNSIT